MSPERNAKSGGDKPLRIYLAGPDVFLRNALEIGQRKKELCARYGFEGVFPIDVEYDVEGKSPREAGLFISAANERLIEGCDVVIANMTPFRGPSVDVGTAFEMGYAKALGLKVCGYTNVAGLFAERTENSLAFFSREKDGTVRDRFDMFVEQHGLVDNLMLDGAVYASGGVLVVEQAPEGELFTYLGGFEKCLQLLRKALSSQP